MESLLFGVEPFDLPTVVVTSLVLFVVSAVAVILPASRASRIPVTDALRVD